jgi:hypothetical protein
MVPTDQPERAFSLLGHFINNEKEWRQWWFKTYIETDKWMIGWIVIMSESI